MKFSILTITIIWLFSSCRNPQQKNDLFETTKYNSKQEGEEFLSKNKPEHKVKIGEIIEIRVVSEKSSAGTDIVWKNEGDCKLVKQLESNYQTRKEDLDGAGGLIILRFEAIKVGNETIIIDQCRIYPKNTYRNCKGEEKYTIEISANEEVSKDIPPNGTLIFTVKDFEGNKEGKWNVVINGNKATIYSLGQEIWDESKKKGDLVKKTNIMKYQGKWISVNDDELGNSFKNLHGGQYEIWDFKNKVVTRG